MGPLASHNAMAVAPLRKKPSMEAAPHADSGDAALQASQPQSESAETTEPRDEEVYAVLLSATSTAATDRAEDSHQQAAAQQGQQVATGCSATAPDAETSDVEGRLGGCASRAGSGAATVTEQQRQQSEPQPEQRQPRLGLGSLPGHFQAPTRWFEVPQPEGLPEASKPEELGPGEPKQKAMPQAKALPEPQQPPAPKAIAVFDPSTDDPLAELGIEISRGEFDRLDNQGRLMPLVGTTYRAAAKRCHPDKGPPEDKEFRTAVFQRITAAYDMLKDPMLRNRARKKCPADEESAPASSSQEMPVYPEAVLVGERMLQHHLRQAVASRINVRYKQGTRTQHVVSATARNAMAAATMPKGRAGVLASQGGQTLRLKDDLELRRAQMLGVIRTAVEKRLARWRARVDRARKAGADPDQNIDLVSDRRMVRASKGWLRAMKSKRRIQTLAHRRRVERKEPDEAVRKRYRRETERFKPPPGPRYPSGPKESAVNRRKRRARQQYRTQAKPAVAIEAGPQHVEVPAALASLSQTFAKAPPARLREARTLVRIVPRIMPLRAKAGPVPRGIKRFSWLPVRQKRGGKVNKKRIAKRLVRKKPAAVEQPTEDVVVVDDEAAGGSLSDSDDYVLPERPTVDPTGQDHLWDDPDIQAHIFPAPKRRYRTSEVPPWQPGSSSSDPLPPWHSSEGRSSRSSPARLWRRLERNILAVTAQTNLPSLA